MTKPNVTLLGCRVLVQKTEPDSTSIGGILLPPSQIKRNTETGIAIEVGKGYTMQDGKIIPLTVKAGDNLIYNRIGSVEVKIDGKEYIIVNETDILAVVHESKKSKV